MQPLLHVLLACKGSCNGAKVSGMYWHVRVHIVRPVKAASIDVSLLSASIYDTQQYVAVVQVQSYV